VSVQLPLDITLRDEATLDRFVTGHNQELFDLLQRFSPSQAQSMILITGVGGSGKTHLLQAVCRETAHAVYLPLAMLARLSGDIFEGLADRPLICVDDLQVLSGNAEMQLALFTLINDLKENGQSFIFSADRKIDQAVFGLKDLVSRLNACARYHLELPEDTHKLAFLRLDAHRRGLQIGNDVINWILTHTPRDMTNLVSLMSRLDQESLRSQRRVTIPFIKQVLGSID